MSNTNRNPSNTQQSDDSTIIRRTLVERGLRPVNDGNIVNGSSSNISAIATIVKQHKDEQRELIELNAKFAVYLDRVQYLENYNQQLLNNLNDLKQTWGGDATELQSTYGPQLQALRNAMDDTLRDQALQELQLKRHEYDLWQIQEQIATLDGDNDLIRFNFLKQELDGSTMELDLLRNQLDQRFIDLTKQRNLMEHLLKELNDLKNELDTQQLERILIENELQTLKEHAAFQDAIYQAQRKEILSLATPVIDVSRFYRIELAHAISDIRQDFEVLSQSQVNELEEYYRVKTEQIRAEIESENERKRLLANESSIESMDKTVLTSSLKDTQNDLIGLHAENKQLQSIFDAIANDLGKIQDEHSRETQFYDHELAQIRQEITNKQETIDNLVENNVSLRFELSTYRRLLDVEEKHMNRVEQGQTLISSYQMPTNQILNDLATKKMTVQKTARG
jgi:chromosome segregation ATPase